MKFYKTTTIVSKKKGQKIEKKHLENWNLMNKIYKKIKKRILTTSEEKKSHFL